MPKVINNDDGSVTLTGVELTDEQVRSIFGEDALLDWSVLPKDDRLKHFLKHDGFGWGGKCSLEECRARTAEPEKLLTQLGIKFEVHEGGGAGSFFRSVLISRETEKVQ